MIRAVNSDPNDNSNAVMIDDEDRYDRLRLIQWWDQKRISKAKVMVVGAGALGNEVVKNLALLGLGEIHIVDLDSVQTSNLSRSVLFREEHAGKRKAVVAAEMAGELNPDCRIFSHCADVTTDIGLGIVREVDVVIGCLDNRVARLWLNRMCFKTGTPWVDGGIQEINGVAKVFLPPYGPCYECGMTENDYRLIALRYSCPLLKKEDVQQGRVPTAPTIASIIGAVQVQETLKLLHELPVVEGAAIVFNGMTNNVYQTKYPLKEDCLSHETYDDIVEIDFDIESSAQELFDRLKGVNAFSEEEHLRLVLDRDFVTKARCYGCNVAVEVHRTRSKVVAELAVCQQCQQPMAVEMVHEVEEGAENSQLSLATLGVPRYDIVKIESELERRHVLLRSSHRSPNPSGLSRQGIQRGCN